MQSTLAPSRVHVAIIMDGNGRWAGARGLPRSAGHRAGADSLRRIVETAPDLGVGTLTVYAFSSDNWKRPPLEVSLLMRLFRQYLHGERDNLVRNGVRLSVIGRRDRLTPAIVQAIADTEKATARGERLHFRVAVDYSGRDNILRAARQFVGDADERSAFARLLSEHSCAGEPVPDVDVLVRTGGEQRLSDFLLWESAYAELFFTKTMWPDFAAGELGRILADFHGRDRRFGGLSGAAVAGGA